MFQPSHMWFPTSKTSKRQVLLAAVLAVAGCSATVSPEDPTDIRSWMELYEVPGVSIAGGEPYFGHGGANDGFRGRMVAHQTAGYGVVILMNSDNGSELSDAVLRLIGQREGWPGY